MSQFPRASEAALNALRGDAVERVAAYYRSGSNYAGATFLAVEPNDPDRVVAADLFAVTLLNADVGPGVARRVLGDATLLLASKAVPADLRLKHADDEVLRLAGTFYERLKLLSSIPGQTSRDRGSRLPKLAARKRPCLLPVRDVLVRRYLGIERPYDYRIDWDIYPRLMLDDLIRGLLSDLPADDPPLRVLDVALWTKARW